MDDSPSVSSILRGSIIGIYICTIGVNVYTTTAIILRIWRVTNTDTSSSTRRGLSFTTRVTAESGLLYTVSSVMGMIAWLNSLDKQTPGSILAVAIFSSINFSMIGIAFNFLLIRVAQQRASSDSTNASASTAGKYIQMTDMRVVQHEITEIASGAPKDRTNSMLPPLYRTIMAAAISEDVANRLSFAGSEAYTVIGHSLDASSSSNKMDLSSQNSYVKDGVLYCNHCTRGQGLMNEEKEIWPPSHPRRTLVLCFDGTGDQFDSDNSNVVELIKILKKDDISKQMVYYQAGIGTYTIPQIATPLMAAFDKKVDEAVAWHINSHVMGGYEFLMQNYNHGDRICLFGFSRGAYIARSLGGMLHKVGLLPPCNHQQVPFAYKMYTTVDETGWKQANAFKKAFSMDVDVEFLGVWDTVSSVGLIPRYLPFPTSNTFIRTFRHAVSLDERRAKFKANLWNRPTAKELALSDFDSDNPRNKMGAVYDENNQIPDEEIDYVKDRNSPTDIKEVWFAGCHCDVGGGSVSNETTVNLARIPLRWMIRECFRRRTGILFVKEGLESLGLKPESLWPVVQQRPPALSPGESDFISRDLSSMTITTAPTVATEEELDLMDALSPIYDQLSLKKMWWLLEIPPLLFYYQGKNNYWYSVLRSNLGRSRDPPANGKMLVHRSVWTRMQARYKDKSESKYKPSIPFDPETVEWVD